MLLMMAIPETLEFWWFGCSKYVFNLFTRWNNVYGSKGEEFEG